MTANHASQQWRTLCAVCGLDPDMATAADITQALQRRMTVVVARDLVRACDAARAYLSVTNDTSCMGRQIAEDLDAALDGAKWRGD